MDLSTRPIAITDLETSGDIPISHEILEIGLILFDPKTFKILDTLDIRVKPTHIETALPIALAVNTFNEKDWENAVSLDVAMQMYSNKTKGAIFCAFNNTFDWPFMQEAFRTTGVKNEMDYHRLDVLTMAWDKGLKNQQSWSLKNTCKWLEVQTEPEPHSAFKGVGVIFEVFKKLNPLS
jgi:DNA polymerase III alpha subunit (gram-positive type)